VYFSFFFLKFVLTESLTGSHLCRLVPEILDADLRFLTLDLANFGTLDLLLSSYWKLIPEIAVRTLGESPVVLDFGSLSPLLVVPSLVE
jgi:hypothetical protein